ncbi:MAG: dipeptidase [Anaerolineae bacterium]
MIARALEHARMQRGTYLEQLFDLLRIPSISTLPEHRPDIDRAAGWLAADMERIGLEHVAVMSTGGCPAVYGDWLHAGPDAPTVLVYGHYDVQPVDPLDLWASPPFEPEIREGRIYARGSNDDKGQAFAHLKAIESLLAAEGHLPVNVRVILEGEEEIGSPNLGPFVAAHRDLLAADAVLISDSAFLRPGQPTLPYGLRGIAAAEIRLSGPKTDLHSGGYGGTVNNPLLALARILAALHDEQGRVRIPGFYDRVRMLDADERAALARVPYTLQDWQAETGMTKPWGEPAFTLLERIGARPTCEVNGMGGGFQGEGSKTIIPSYAFAKITMRLVPHQDPDEITRLFTDYVRSIAPDDLRLEVTIGHRAPAVLTPREGPAMQAAAQAYQAVWGVEPVYSLGGGTIGVVASFQQELGAPVVLMGFSLPDAGAHAPNEWFAVEHYDKGIETIIHFYHALAAGS